MVRIFDALNAKLKSAFFPQLLAPAAEQRSMDRAIFIPAEFHGNAPVGLALVFISALLRLDYRKKAGMTLCIVAAAPSCSSRHHAVDEFVLEPRTAIQGIFMSLLYRIDLLKLQKT